MRHTMRLLAIALLAASGAALWPICCAAFAAEPEVIKKGKEEKEEKK